METFKFCLFIHINQWAPIECSDTVPISEGYILAYLKKHGFFGKILGDFSNMPLRPSVLVDAIKTYRPIILGFTTYQENIERVRLWARYAKRIDPKIKVIIGGPQVTFMPALALKHMPEVDFLCRGEGEEVMLNLVKALIEERDLKDIPGLCFLEGDEAIETEPANGYKDLDMYPSPYLMDLIDLQYKQQVIIITSRGCPFDCAFCYTPRASNRTVRFHSVDRVIEEMRYLKSKGIRNFWFADPNFSYSKEHLIEMLEAMIEKVPGISFWCQTRYDLIDTETLALLKRAGAKIIAYGLESVSKKALKKIRKRMDLERLSEAIHLTQKEGIRVELFTMFGLPEEDFKDALSTIEYVKGHKILIEGNSVSQQLHLFFGTPITENPSHYGIHPIDKTRPAYMSICRDFETDTMSKEEIWQVALIWGLNREEFIEDILAERNLFNRANFIMKNKEALASQPLSYYFLARIYLALEEYEAALKCFEILKKDFPEDPAVKRFLMDPIKVFKVKYGPAEIGDKVIYDCQGFLDGRLVPLTHGRYQVSILGDGGLLSDFEEGIKGLHPGGFNEFPVSFPDNYYEPSLAGKVIRFQAMVHLVMEPVIVEKIEDLAKVPKNIYYFPDLTTLREYNENLYYMVLRNTTLRGLGEDLVHYLSLMNFYLKLGFVERALSLLKNLPQEPRIMGYAARIFRINGLAEMAFNILNGVEGDGNIELIKAESLFDLKRWDEAEEILNRIYNKENVRILDLLAKIAIEKNLPVEEYLKRFNTFLDAQIEFMLKRESLWGRKNQ